MDGRIKIHRKILDWWWYDDGNTFRVFFHLLCVASYQKQVYKWIELLPWQCAIWRKYLSQKLKLGEQQIRRAIFNLQTTSEIAVKTTNRYSLITICKWEDHQIDIEKQPTKRPAELSKLNTQTTTNKEVNNIIYITSKDDIREIYNEEEIKEKERQLKTIYEWMMEYGYRLEKKKKAIEELIEWIHGRAMNTWWSGQNGLDWRTVLTELKACFDYHESNGILPSIKKKNSHKARIITRLKNVKNGFNRKK